MGDDWNILLARVAPHYGRFPIKWNALRMAQRRGFIAACAHKMYLKSVAVGEKL
jgi:hypothetical protein